MGVFTSTDKPLGLKMSNRMKNMLELMRNGQKPEMKDIEYLFDEACRFYTFDIHVRSNDFKIEDMMLDQAYYLKDTIGDLVMELRYLYGHNVGQDGTFSLELNHFSPFYESGGVEGMTPASMKAEAHRAVQQVRDLQKVFDNNKDDLQVIGKFKYLKEIYGLDLNITANADENEVQKAITHHVLDFLKKQREDKDKAINNIQKMIDNK